WDNALHMAPAMAQKLGLKKNDKAELKLRGKSITAAVLPTPGHADDSITVALGYGRNLGAEVVAQGAGVDVNPLRAAGRWFEVGASVERAKGTEKLAVTQEHWVQESRPIVIELPNKIIGKKQKAEGEEKGKEKEEALTKELEENRGPVPSMYKEHI